MNDHDLTQLVEGVSNRGLPPGCYINQRAVASKRKRLDMQRLVKAVELLERRVEALEKERAAPDGIDTA